MRVVAWVIHHRTTSMTRMNRIMMVVVFPRSCYRTRCSSADMIVSAVVMIVTAVMLIIWWRAVGWNHTTVMRWNSCWISIPVVPHRRLMQMIDLKRDCGVREIPTVV